MNFLCPEPYLKVEQVLEILAISRATLHRWMEDGFPVHGRTRHHLRFRMSEIEKWMSDDSRMESTLSTSTMEITG